MSRGGNGEAMSPPGSGDERARPSDAGGSVGGFRATARLRRWRALDRIALGGIAAGLALYVVPLFEAGRLRSGFWLTLAATALHIYTSSSKPTGSRAYAVGNGAGEERS